MLPGSPVPQLVSLLDIDRQFEASVPLELRAAAAAALPVVVHALPAGEWNPFGVMRTDGESSTTALLLTGQITRHVSLGGRVNAQLALPGDIVGLWDDAGSSLGWSSRWVSHGTTTLAVLDGRMLDQAKHWPELLLTMQRRLLEQAREAASRTALLGLPRIEQRLIAFFLELADRRGAVTADGIVVSCSFTHRLLGELIGARRPTVTRALLELRVAGTLVRLSGSQWRMAPDASVQLAGLTSRRRDPAGSWAA